MMKEMNEMVEINYRNPLREKTCTIPIFFLLIYILFTFFPLLYACVPILGQMKIVLLSGIFLVMSYMTSRAHYTNSEVSRNSIYISWIWFAGIMCVGLLTSLDRGSTLEILLTNLKYFLVFLVMVHVIDTPKRLELVLATLTACGTGMALGSLYTYFLLPQNRVDGYRAVALNRGLFGDPNDLALLLNAILPFALYFFLKKRNKIIPVLCILIIIAGIMLTFSRGGFLGLSMTGLGIFVFFGKKRKYVLPVLAAAFLFWSFAPGAYKERISTISSWQVDKKTGMTNTRMDAWRIVLNESLNHWVLGAGAGSSWYIAGKEMNDWHGVHNTFVQVFAEMGLFALICYLLLFIQPFRQYKMLTSRMKTLQTPIDTTRFKIILISLMSYATTAFFLPQAYCPIIYTLTAVAVIESELMKKADQTPPQAILKPSY